MLFYVTSIFFYFCFSINDKKASLFIYLFYFKILKKDMVNTLLNIMSFKNMIGDFLEKSSI